MKRVLSGLVLVGVACFAGCKKEASGDTAPPATTVVHVSDMNTVIGRSEQGRAVSAGYG